jgi:hypothetical protein
VIAHTLGGAVIVGGENRDVAAGQGEDGGGIGALPLAGLAGHDGARMRLLPHGCELPLRRQ